MNKWTNFEIEQIWNMKEFQIWTKLDFAQISKLKQNYEFKQFSNLNKNSNINNNKTEQKIHKPKKIN
jgi:hypothetical protein